MKVFIISVFTFLLCGLAGCSSVSNTSTDLNRVPANRESAFNCAEFADSVPHLRITIEGKVFPLDRLAPRIRGAESSMRFGAQRRLRCKATSGLVGYHGDEVRSIGAGVIIDSGLFYRNTYFVTVKQEDGLVVRYAPLKKRLKSRFGKPRRSGQNPEKVGDPVLPGTVLGELVNVKGWYFGMSQKKWEEEGYATFYPEIYDRNQNSGRVSGSGPFKRVKTLLNPTQFLIRLCGDQDDCTVY